MERIEILLSKLNEQFQQGANPAQLLGTVQLLQFELTKLKTGSQQSLGTAKVAVVLPFAGVVAEAAGYEKYAPRPVEKQVQEVKERLLVEEGSLSGVKKNGQLDMVFDPMMEIPTLANQPRETGKEVNDTARPGESVHDKIKQEKTELLEVLKETPVKDLRKAIGINDRFLFINDLFRGDETTYERSIKTINSFNIYPEAEYWISRELKTKLGWNKDHPLVRQFDQLVKRRFS